MSVLNGYPERLLVSISKKVLNWYFKLLLLFLKDKSYRKNINTAKGIYRAPRWVPMVERLSSTSPLTRALLFKKEKGKDIDV